MLNLGPPTILPQPGDICLRAYNALLQPNITFVVRDEEIIFPLFEYYTYSTKHLVRTYYV